MERTYSFDNLAVWGDSVSSDDEDAAPHPSTIDPRPTPGEIVELDTQLTELQKKIAEMTLLRTRLLAERALILRIPPELLARTFELAVHTSPSTQLRSLSLVSKAWHGITMSTPCLHTYIQLDDQSRHHSSPTDPADTRTSIEVFLDIVKLQLGRSHDSKLHVDIDFRYLDGVGDIRNIMGVLKPHLAKCFYFRASVPDAEWLAIVKEFTVELGESLEELHLYIDSSDVDDPTIATTFLQNVCTRLKVINLEHTPLTAIRPHVPPPPPSDVVGPAPPPGAVAVAIPPVVPPILAILTPDEEAAPEPTPPPPELPPTLHPALQTLAIIRDRRHTSSAPSPSFRMPLPFGHFLQTLSTTPTLTSLHLQSIFFTLSGTEPIFHPHLPKVQLDTLKVLELDWIDGVGINLLMDSFEFGGLETLRIQMDASNSTSSSGSGGDDNLGFLARYSPPLSLAQLASANIPWQLSPFPSLQHLDLRNVSTTGAALYPFIRALHALPQLTALGLSTPPTGCFGINLFDMLATGSLAPDDADAPAETSSTASAKAEGTACKKWILPRLQALIIQSARDISGHELLKVVRARVFASRMRDVAITRGLNVVGKDVEIITYLKIAGCYSVDKEGEIAEELKRLVKKVVLV